MIAIDEACRELLNLARKHGAVGITLTVNEGGHADLDVELNPFKVVCIRGHVEGNDPTPSAALAKLLEGR